ncbi:MAG: hypothetical protein VB099_03450 [Candidatus Limiplasma sp.]|nr:hypothetical protein [Candidatus Limiplasma sp.]
MENRQEPLGPEGSYYEAKARRDQERFHRKMAGVYPLFITGLYLVLGFLFGLWHPGWLLFLTIPLFYMRPATPWQKLTNPVAITLIYLILGFYFHLWHPGWMIFLVIPVAAVLGKTDKA